MNPDIIRAFIWQDIIRLGFSPTGDNNKSNWLQQYNKSLRFFWETDVYPAPPKKTNAGYSSTIDCMASIDIAFEYMINATNKFTVSIMNPLNNLLWTHDYDVAYYSFPQDGRIPLCHKQNDRIQEVKRVDAINECNRTHFAEVIQSLLTHPTPHQHISSPINRHLIRIGGGIINPFLYLFNLRFQFCPDMTRQTNELNRLVELFEFAIRDNKLISANDLMKVP